MSYGRNLYDECGEGGAGEWDQDIVHHHDGAQVVVCNSGIANACTGEEGMGYCRATAEEAARMLHVPETAVLVASTE